MPPESAQFTLMAHTSILSFSGWLLIVANALIPPISHNHTAAPGWFLS